MEQELNIEYKNIKELKPYKKNAKKHDKKQVEQIANSIKEFGFTQPVIVDRNNVVVAGHGRILGAKKAGVKKVPTVCLEDLTEEQIKAYRLADNKLNESEWDLPLLDEELDLLQEDLNMELFGFELELEPEEIEEEPAKQNIEYFSNDEIQQNIIEGFETYETVEDYVKNIMDVPKAKYEFNRLCSGYDKVGYNISLLFNPHRLDTDTIKGMSIFKAINGNPTYRKQFARYMVNVHGKVLTNSEYHKIIGIGTGGVQYVNEFQPCIARDIYKKYCKEGYRILDPCSGWGGRTIGLASCMFKDITYITSDPSKRTYEGLLKLKDFLQLPDTYKYFCKPFEDMKIKPNSIDFCFTSTPYYDTEHYSEDKEQSYRRYETYEKWKQCFLYKLIDKIIESLKKDRYCLLNVGNVKYKISDDITAYLENKNIEWKYVTEFKLGGYGIGARTNKNNDEGIKGEVFIEFKKN